MAFSNKIPHDRQVLALSFLAGLPAVLLAMWLLWNGPASTALRWTLSIAVVGCWLGFVIATGMLHLAGIAFGLLTQWPQGRLAVRAAGSVIAIAGLVFLGRLI